MNGRIRVVIAKDGSIAVDIDEPPEKCEASDRQLRALLELLGVTFVEVRDHSPPPPIPDGIVPRVKT